MAMLLFAANIANIFYNIIFLFYIIVNFFTRHEAMITAKQNF